MPDLEKVMKGLACFSNPYAQVSDDRDCKNCPYDECTCFLDVSGEAASLIRAQQERIRELESATQPRLMTLEESRKRDISYVELRAEDNILPCIVGSPGDGYVIQVKPLQGFNRIFPRRDYYGKDWRCWTERPTDKQREAAPWVK